MKNNEGITSVLKDMLGGIASETAIATTVSGMVANVSEFLQDKLVINAEAIDGVNSVNSSFGLEGLSDVGSTGVSELVEQLGVPAEYQSSAAAEIALILANAAAGKGSTATTLATHFKRPDATDMQLSAIELDSILPDFLQGSFSAGMEHFGADTNKLSADVTTAIAITAMKYHNTIAGRMLPTLPTQNPVVRYIREEELVFDLAAETDQLIPLTTVYKNPSLIKNKLRKIVPQAAYVTESGAVVAEEGFLPLGSGVNLAEAGLDASDPKYGAVTMNRTDMVAEGASIEEVLVSIDADSGGDPVKFAVTVPNGQSTLLHVPGGVSTARRASVKFSADIGIDQLNLLGAVVADVETILGPTSTDKLRLTFNLTANLDNRTFMADSFGIMDIVIVNAAGVALVDQTALDPATISFDGVKLDACYSEENFRKSSIIGTQEVSELRFVVPQGRFYGADRSHLEDSTGERRTSQIAMLQRLAGTGQDAIMTETIEGIIARVNDETIAHTADPIANPRPGLKYAAGGKVIPSVIYGFLNLGGIDAFDDAHLAAAIGGRVNVIFGAIITDLMQASMMRQQMMGEKLVIRALCSGTLLGKVFAMGTKSVAATNGSEYSLELPDGTKVEFVTTTNEDIGDRVIMVPYLSNPESDLNFGHNRSLGTVVCGFDVTHPDTASAKRIMASLREAPIPTNVVAAVVTVKGLDEAQFGDYNEVYVAP